MRPHDVVNRTRLAHQMASRAGCSIKESLKNLDAFTSSVTSNLKMGNPVYLYRFGHFATRRIPAHNLHDLHSGKVTKIPNRDAPVFYPSRILKAKCHQRNT